MKKKVISIQLVLAMVLAMTTPVTALAAEVSEGTIQVYAAAEENSSAPQTSASEKKTQEISGVEHSYSVVYGDKSMTLTPQTTGDGTFSFQSDAPALADVNAAGVVTIQSVGTANITVTASETSTYQAAQFTTQVTVSKAKQTISGVPSSLTKTYQAGDTDTLKPKTTGDGTFSYDSSNTAVVSVSTAGKVSIRSAGTATITVTAGETSNYLKAQKNVKVTVEQGKQTISGVSSSYTRLYQSGSSFTLKGKSSGDGAVTYRSSDTSVATVGKTSGKVTMKKRGTCTITVTAAGTKNYKSAAKKVTVTLYKKAASMKASKYYKKSKYYQRLRALKLIGSARKNILAIANSQMGYHEGNKSSQLGGTSSGSGNYTEYGYYYGLQGAWCAMFVNWCARENNTSTKDIPRYCAVMNYYSYYHKKGQHFYSWAKTKGGKGSYTPKAGDLIFYSTRLGGATHHIGYVKSCSVRSGKITVTTLEGNTSDQARSKSYTLKRGSNGRITSSWYIRGFASPNY